MVHLLELHAQDQVLEMYQVDDQLYHAQLEYKEELVAHTACQEALFLNRDQVEVLDHQVQFTLWIIIIITQIELKINQLGSKPGLSGSQGGHGGSSGGIGSSGKLYINYWKNFYKNFCSNNF